MLQATLTTRAIVRGVRLYHRASVASASAQVDLRASVGASPGISSYNSSSPHNRLDSIGCDQSHRVSASKNSDSAIRIPENSSTCESSHTHRNNNYGSTSSRQQQIHVHVGNVTKMLRYQEFSPRESRPANSSRKESRRGEISNQDYAAPNRTASPLPSSTAHLKSNPKLKRDTSNTGISNERPRWRNRKETTRSEKHISPKKQNNVATSEWIQVSSTPPMSKLSDLFPSLNRIIEFELQKGVIDLNIMERLKHTSDSNYTTVLHALDELHASKSLYATETINDVNSTIPLWTPDSSSPMILEARVQLSYRAQPVGWFIRLPCRSLVNAVLNHVRRANKLLLTSVEYSKLKQERKKWREGLWKGVYVEYESTAEKKANQSALEDELHDEKELMWGHGNIREEVEEYATLDPLEGQSDTTTSFYSDQHDNEGADYVQSYMQNHPFPSQVVMPSSYQPLRSGSTIVSVREFSPSLSDISFTADKHIPWEQHAFHMSPLLKISDSVVRVETSDLSVTEEDIQFLFRGYDLASISDSTESTDLPFGFDSFLKSLGWNIPGNGNAEILVQGIHAPRERIPKRGQTKGVPIRANSHTFLVRLSSPAEARMAVRDINGYFLREFGDRLHVTAFPSSDL